MYDGISGAAAIVKVAAAPLVIMSEPVAYDELRRKVVRLGVLYHVCQSEACVESEDYAFHLEIDIHAQSAVEAFHSGIAVLHAAEKVNVFFDCLSLIFYRTLGFSSYS